MEIGGQVFERDSQRVTRARSLLGYGNQLTSLRVNLRVNWYNGKAKPRVWDVPTCVPVVPQKGGTQVKPPNCKALTPAYQKTVTSLPS